MDGSPHTAQGSAHSSEYLHNWDRLRIIGSLDIIGSHLNGAHIFGGVGLPAFLIVSLALSVRSNREHDLAGFLRVRTRRILVPWLFWSLVIAIELSLRAARGGRAWRWLKPEMLLYGPEIHLWFLPFVVVAGSACAALQQRMTRVAPRRLGWTAIFVALGCVAFCPYVGRGWPFEQWIFSLPAVCLGFGVGRLLLGGSKQCRLEMLAAALLFGLGACTLWSLLPLTAPFAKRHAGAMLLVTACTWLPNAPDPITRRLAPLMLGVYTLQLFVYRSVVGPLLHHLALEHSAALRVVATFVVSAAVVACLKRSPLSHVL